MAIREAVAVFESEAEMLHAVDELGSVGVDRAEISVLPAVEAVEKQRGHELRSIREKEDDPAIARAIPFDMPSFGAAQGVLIGAPAYVGAISMAIASAVIVDSYWTIALLVATGGALGALIGYFLARWLKSSHQQRIRRQLDRGGLVLWVHLRDKQHEKSVAEVLSRHAASDLHTHNFSD